MKKIISLLILISLLFAFTGCESLEEDNRTIIYFDSEEKLEFSTVDIDGNSVTEDIIKDAKVIMINFWEPWCGPCVGEMPELEKLYENYKDQGLLILGVFSTADMEDEVREVLKECNTTYPILHSDSKLEKYMTEYVPTTIFADSEGNIISSEPIVRAYDYSAWEEIVTDYLSNY